MQKISKCQVQFRVGLGYIKEVYQLRISGECSNMIGYKMGSSRVGVHTHGQDFSGGELQPWMEK
jgi:hypothetical protein